MVKTTNIYIVGLYPWGVVILGAGEGINAEATKNSGGGGSPSYNVPWDFNISSSLRV